MENFVKIKDLVKLNFVNMVEIKDNYLMPSNQVNQPVQKGLLVKIAATHSGIVNRNHMFYLPEKMRAGAKTFLDHFAKPILLNHDELSDPIGRVVDAKYVDISTTVRDKYIGKNVRDSITKKQLPFNEALFDNFCNGKLSYAAEVDFVRSYIADSVLDDADYQGLGYVEITANITDKDAIDKFLDGRYLTGSVGAQTDRAVCSICKQDWTKEGMCDHKLGKIYDSTKAFLIAGNFSYDEYSVANKPADRHSKVIELNFNGVRDTVSVEDTDYSGRIYEVRVEFPKEERVMTVKDAEKKSEEQKETPVVQDNASESFDDFVTRILDFDKGDLNDSDEEKLYSLMLDEMKAASLSEKEIEDAKLSTEKRKGLAKSTFCGPNRSFPVPDCAHVVAARRLIGRYNGPGNKDSILSCVSRKAKAMGCTQDSVVENATPDITQTFDKLDNAKLKTTFLGLADLFKKKDPDGYKEFVKNVEINLLDEVISLENKLGEQREMVTSVTKQLTDSQAQHAALKQEYDLVTRESEVLQDTAVKAKSALVDAKVARLSLLRTLQEGKVVDLKDSTATMSEEVIDKELETLSKSIDINKIADKLNDGTSRRPQGIIGDPTGQNSKKIDPAVVRDRLSKINQEYMERRFKNSLAADQWLEYQMTLMRNEGLLPEGNS